MPSGQVPNLVNDLKNSTDFNGVLTRYHQDCYGQSNIINHIEAIKHCFTIGQGIEWTFSRLRAINDQWSMDTLKTLESMCPLSLKISYESFMRGFVMDLKGCLTMEYSLVMQLTVHRRTNFWVGIKAKLIDKKKETPEWVPASILEVNDIGDYFANVEGPWLNLN